MRVKHNNVTDYQNFLTAKVQVRWCITVFIDTLLIPVIGVESWFLDGGSMN